MVLKEGALFSIMKTKPEQKNSSEKIQNNCTGFKNCDQMQNDRAEKLALLIPGIISKIVQRELAKSTSNSREITI